MSLSTTPCHHTTGTTRCPYEWAITAAPRVTVLPVLVALARLALDHDRGPFPATYPQIARLAGMPTRNVQLYMPQLRDAGLVSWESGQGRAPNRYVVHWDRPAHEGVAA